MTFIQSRNLQLIDFLTCIKNTILLNMFSDRPQPFSSREVEAIRLRALWLQDNLTEHTQRPQ